MINLMQGDCLELMREIPDGSVDMILCDLPYGTTACKWDTVIPFAPLWAHYKRAIKPSGAIVLFGSQPFTSALVMSNINEYRHQWVWNKNNSAGFATAKIRPMAICEDILVFGKRRVNYYPQMIKGKMRKKGGTMSDDSKLEYIKEFDAYCHPNGEWEEPKCTDPECEYCAHRPATAHGWMKVAA